jgi:Trk K+ transport system NAD-binding subunit
MPQAYFEYHVDTKIARTSSPDHNNAINFIRAPPELLPELAIGFRLYDMNMCLVWCPRPNKE